MPELRRDPLLNRWVVFSTERTQRPQEYGAATLAEPPVDPFVWGHEHLTTPEVYADRPPISATPNTPGWRVRVVPNRFPALRVEGELNREAEGPYDRMNGIGAHEVIIETPEPETPLEEQSVQGVLAVLRAYRSRSIDLTRDSRFQSLVIFKNSGALAGATLRHAHSQLVALPVVPPPLRQRVAAARAYYRAKERSLFDDILRYEQREQTRMVFENGGAAVFCPYASRFPFELQLWPKRSAPYFHHCSDEELEATAEALRNALRRLSKGLGKPDYNFILHTAPLPPSREAGEGDLRAEFRWHIEILPRTAGMGGFELGTDFTINSTLPEEAAQFLRSIKLKS